MKSLSDASFFRVFELLVASSNPGLKMDRWNVDDVQCQRERHSFSGSAYCFAIEVFALSRARSRRWSLIVTKEYWWDGDHKHAIKALRWSRPTQGSRRDIIEWFRGHEHAFKRI